MNQLALDVRLKKSATFDSFYVGHGNDVVHTFQQALESGNGERIYLWGVAATGKTHLLQAACHFCNEQSRITQYVDLSQWRDQGTGALDALHEVSCLCLDNIDQIAGLKDWEQSIFHLADRMKSSGNTLIVSGPAQPDASGLLMPELVSRLGNGLVLVIPPLTDPEKGEALRLQGKMLGLRLDDKVVDYLVSQHGGDPSRLFDSLDDLDRGSLAVKRKISLKMAKQLLQ